VVFLIPLLRGGAQGGVMAEVC